MSLVTTSEIINMQGFVVGVNAIVLEQAEALITAAQSCGIGIVLQLSENTVDYHGAFRPMAAALLEMAKDSSVPIAVHLDHATRSELVREAIEFGFSSVMFDGSKLSYKDNLSETKLLAALAKSHSVWFEAELGEIGGKDGVHAPGVRTNPLEAREFVEETKVDGLAVAVGSSHAMVEKGASLDLELIARLRESVSVPLVLHGSSGVAIESINQAIVAGIRKINVATEMNLAFNKPIQEYFAEGGSLSDPRKYLIPARSALSKTFSNYLLSLTGTVDTSRR